MRFSSPLTLSWSGIHFKTKKRCVFIPWSAPYHYHSTVFEEVSVPYKNSSKLKGMDYEEVIAEWAQLKYFLNHVIILTNINVEAKNIQFWAKVPRTDMIEFVKDVVILHCQDKSEVIRLAENIPNNFAYATGYSAGELVITNEETL